MGTVNGTTLAMAKKGSGVAEKVNPCLAKFMATKEYHDICVKYDLTNSCYRNEFFTDNEMKDKEYNKPTDEHKGDCSNGYCPCVVEDYDMSSASTYVIGGGILALVLRIIMV